MIELVELRGKILESGALSLDLETTSKKPREAKITLVALAAGRGADIRSAALPPTDEVLKFVREWVYDPTIRLVGHNLVTYDLLVLHLNGVIDFSKIRAKIADTLPLAWLYNEKIDHGLKFLAWKFFNQKMVTYEEAFLTSPKIQMVKSVSLGIESQRDLLDRLDEDTKKAKKKENTLYTRSLKEKFKDFQGSRAEKIKAKELCIRKIGRRLEIQYGEAALERKRKEMERSIILLSEQKKVYEIEAEMDQRAYAADDAKQTLRLFRRLRRELEVKDLLRWADIEVKSRIVAGHMMISGAPIDVGRLQAQDEVFIPLIQEFEADVTDAAKMSFNPGSNKELSHILYDILGLIDVTGERKTEEKNLSRLDHPISQAVLNYRTVKKLHSTYVRKLFAIAKENDGRVYGTVNPHGAETGRASASDPNLQNIPSKKKPAEYDERIQNLGPRIRWVFKPKPGKKLICADLSQIELRITTTVTGDKNLLDVYGQNTVYNGLTYWTGDIHDKTAKALNISRKIAKNLNFGLTYGMGPEKFAVYAKLYKPGTKTYDIEKAKEFKNQFMSFYQGVPDTLDLIDGLINGRDGYPRKNFRMLSGRCRHFQDNEEFFFGTAFNAIIQGSAADVLKVILWKLYEGIILNPEFAGTKLVWQVHDEVGIEVDDAIAEKVAIITKYIMERPWFPLPVPVLASVKICEDWSGKDDDYVPEVGIFYARLSDKGTVTDRIFTSNNWKEFADFEEAAKKDEKAKKPVNESKIVLVKPCVAMLTPKQEAMAAAYCPTVESYSDPNGYNHTETES